MDLSSEGERSTGLSSERRDPQVSQAKGRDRLVFQAKGETCWSLKQTCHVCSPAVALIHTKGPRYRRKICVNSLSDYIPTSHTSPSKNKSINHIFIYLWVLRSLSSGAIGNN